MKLGLKRADRLIRLAEQLEELPLLDQAFARGEIGWTTLREIASVATQDNEATWVEFVRTQSSREVEAATVKARRGLDLETLRDVHEPWLERMGLVERTKRGRVATEKARELYGGKPPRLTGIPVLKHWPRRA